MVLLRKLLFEAFEAFAAHELFQEVLIVVGCFFYYTRILVVRVNKPQWKSLVVTVMRYVFHTLVI